MKKNLDNFCSGDCTSCSVNDCNLTVNINNFFKFISNEEMLELESIYNYHLTLTTDNKFNGVNLTPIDLNKIYRISSRNLDKIFTEKIIRGI